MVTDRSHSLPARWLLWVLLTALTTGCLGPWDDQWGGQGGSLVGDDDDSATVQGDDDDATGDDDDATGDDDDATGDDDDATGDDDDSVPGVETACADGADNDQDGDFDCDDSDCWSDPACTGDDDDDDDDSAPVDPDSDADGWPASMDCDDGDAFVSPGAWEVCTGGVDEDCDGLVDCDDSSCDMDVACAVEDPWEENDSVLSAVDVTTFPTTFTGVLCPGDPDWFSVCTSVSANITIELYESSTNPGTGPVLDTLTYSDVVPSGYAYSEMVFGLQFPAGSGGDCDGYVVTMTLNGPYNCP